MRMEWYLDYDGKQFGPLTVTQARSYVRTNSSGLAWREGFLEWVPIKEITELMVTSSKVSGSPTGIAPPPSPSVHTSTSDEVDYKIFGAEMQFVEVELDPGESVIAEAGAMMYKDSTVDMDTIFGDGSAKSSQIRW